MMRSGSLGFWMVLVGPFVSERMAGSRPAIVGWCLASLASRPRTTAQHRTVTPILPSSKRPR